MGSNPRHINGVLTSLCPSLDPLGRSGGRAAEVEQSGSVVSVRLLNRRSTCPKTDKPKKPTTGLRRPIPVGIESLVHASRADGRLVTPRSAAEVFTRTGDFHERRKPMSRDPVV